MQTNAGAPPKLYNSRIIDSFIKLIKSEYGYVDINAVLAFAGIEPYQINDEGHWFTQQQIDRFHRKLTEVTDNADIAREAGRYAASPDAIGTMRQFVLGMVGPIRLFEVIGKATHKLTRSSDYAARKLAANKIEITVTPKQGVREKPFQCQNRIGFFESVALMFDAGLPKIQHPDCMFKGAPVCRYVITLDRSTASVWRKIRRVSATVLAALVLPLLYFYPPHSLLYYLPLAACGYTLLSEICLNRERKEIKASHKHLTGAAGKLLEQIDINYNNARLVNAIGQAVSQKTNIDGALQSIIQVFEKHLDFDRGLILLRDQVKNRLIFRAAYGIDDALRRLIKKTSFRLNSPDSKGVFIDTYHKQKPFLVNEVRDILPDLSPHSREFTRRSGTRSFISCPIVCEGVSLGVLAVDCVDSRKQLTQQDINLLMGLAPVIGISIRNAELHETTQRQLRSMIQVMAISIDARDPLTSGHSEKVTEYALGICDELGLSFERKSVIRVASLLHDYGKIGVPDDILKKKGCLSRTEFEIIKTHAIKTREILDEINFEGMYARVPDIAGAHHEKMDGSGYPQGLRGEEIPLGARIIAVADFFEAITAKRHYRDPMPVTVACQLLKEARGAQFDEIVVDAFLRFFNTRHAVKSLPLAASL